MYNDPEIVICAAILAQDGRVFRCHRHNHGIDAARAAGTKPAEFADSNGFITSRNRFVT